MKFMNIKALIKTLIIATALNGFVVTNSFAQSDEDRERAMQIAEAKTGGKSLRARYIERRKGYRVRVMQSSVGNDTGRVIHIFIPLSDV